MIRLPTIAVAAGDTGAESYAIRHALEYFGYRVLYLPIGRPKDCIAVLNRSALYPGITDLILCVQGKEGAILMPELDASVYEADEPRGPFDAAAVRAYGDLPGMTVVTTGCTLGREDMASAFLDSGCMGYIAPVDYVDGNAAHSSFPLTLTITYG